MENLGWSGHRWGECCYFMFSLTSIILQQCLKSLLTMFLKLEMKIKMQTAWVMFEDYLLERNQGDIVAADRKGV